MSNADFEIWLEWEFMGRKCRICVRDMAREVALRGIDGLMEMVQQVRADEHERVMRELAATTQRLGHYRN